jgi:hypothetical protein
MRPYFKKTHYKKRAGGVAQGVGPEFKPQYHKINKQNKTNGMNIEVHLLSVTEVV